MNIINQINKINEQLKAIESKLDTLKTENRRYQKEISFILAYHPELEDYFSEATKKEAGL